jgi:hypothetical protein
LQSADGAAPWRRAKVGTTFAALPRRGERVKADRAEEVIADSLTRVRDIVLELADVEEGTTFGFPAFKVRGKLLAWFPKKKEVEPATLAVRVSILERDHRVATRAAVFYVTPHYQDYPCVLARVQRMSEVELEELLQSGYEFVLAELKSRRRGPKRR